MSRSDAGIGDLNGITRNLGHVAALAVDAIWLARLSLADGRRRRAIGFRCQRMTGMVLDNWSRDRDVIRLDCAGGRMVLNFGRDAVETEGVPDLASGPMTGPTFSARTGVV
ncbi:hypothetical protein [uncultured Jannaschia sp.]|uniref:hypothetical protein n=1 Tax=uncultured Jannaschia sp. TaxID=293347 RepID=UPI002612BCA3|nr:hypothetical protein [uncultured Jannaschia sp.]